MVADTQDAHPRIMDGAPRFGTTFVWSTDWRRLPDAEQIGFNQRARLAQAREFA